MKTFMANDANIKRKEAKKALPENRKRLFVRKPKRKEKCFQGIILIRPLRVSVEKSPKTRPTRSSDS